MKPHNKIAIIGSGIAGLSLAYKILKNHPEIEVIIYEKGSRVGGLAVPFDIQGTQLEAFYHHIFTTDSYILGLINELGLSDKLKWHIDNRATMYKGKLYPFTSPLDLLSFTPLPLIDRLRLAAVSFYVTRIKDWKRLEGKTADEWMTKYAGEKTYTIFWRPLLYGKFQEFYKEITMSWLWSRIVARLTSKGKLGYMEGSFGVLFTKLESEIRARGGIIKTNVNITNVEDIAGKVHINYSDTENMIFDDTVDTCILTTAPAVFTKFVKGFSQDYVNKITNIKYISAQTIVLTLKEKLTDFYWVSVADLNEPALVLVEQSNLINVYNKKHIVYIGNYLPNDSDILKMDEENIKNLYYPFLKRINNNFSDDWVEEFRVFRAPFAQPIVDREYHNKIPAFASPLENIYILTMSQVYPEDRGMNYAIKNAMHLYDMLNF